MSTPLVSVCIPSAGHGEFVAEAVESALAQGGDELEVLVHIDGGDTAQPPAGDRRLRWRRHPHRLGVAANRNSLLAAARGRYVAWLDADDVLLPGSLDVRLAALEANPSAALVHGAARIVDAGGSPLPPWRRPFERDAVETGDAAFAELALANELTTSTVLVRRSAHDDAGPFRDIGPASSDWEMWLRLALRGDVAYVAEEVACYRQHPQTISRMTSVERRFACDARAVRGGLRAATVVPGLPEIARRAGAALSARALLTSRDLRLRGERAAAARMAARAGRLAPRVVAPRVPALLAATARGDEHAAHRGTRVALGRLAETLAGSRYGAALSATIATDPGWSATLARIAAAVRGATPADAVVATVTKWDPTLLELCARAGRQFPDRRLLPGGYPADGREAVEHVDDLVRDGLTHLVLPRVWDWWLERYDGFAERLGAAVHADDDCLIFRLEAP